MPSRSILHHTFQLSIIITSVTYKFDIFIVFGKLNNTVGILQVRYLYLIFNISDACFISYNTYYVYDVFQMHLQQHTQHQTDICVHCTARTTVCSFVLFRCIVDVFLCGSLMLGFTQITVHMYCTLDYRNGQCKISETTEYFALNNHKILILIPFCYVNLILQSANLPQNNIY